MEREQKKLGQATEQTSGRKGKIEWIKVSAVVHSTESREKVSKTLETIFPFDFTIEVSRATGHFGNPMEYLEVEISEKEKIYEFWANLIKLLGSQIEEVLASLYDRIDAQNVLHIKIDKQKSYLGKVELAKGGDAISIKCKLVVYSKKKEKVVEFARSLCMIS